MGCYRIGWGRCSGVLVWGLAAAAAAAADGGDDDGGDGDDDERNNDGEDVIKPDQDNWRLQFACTTRTSSDRRPLYTS